MKLPVLSYNGDEIEAYGYIHCYKDDENYYIGFSDDRVEALRSNTKEVYKNWQEVERFLIHPELELSSILNHVYPYDKEAIMSSMQPDEYLVKNVTDVFNGQYGILKGVYLFNGGIGLTNKGKAIVYGENVLKPSQILFYNVKDVFIYLKRYICILNENGTIEEQGMLPGADFYHPETQLKTQLKNILQWKNIVKVSSSNTHLLALLKDGTVLAAGLDSWDICKTQSWNDVVDIFASDTYSIGLRKDGNMYSTGIMIPKDTFQNIIAPKAYNQVVSKDLDFEQFDHAIPLFGKTIGWNCDGKVVIARIDNGNVNSYELHEKIIGVVPREKYDNEIFIVSENGNTFLIRDDKKSVTIVPELKKVKKAIGLRVLQEDGTCYRIVYARKIEYVLEEENVLDIGEGDDYRFYLYNDHHVKMDV